jgi:hypothetical protein
MAEQTCLISTKNQEIARQQEDAYTEIPTPPLVEEEALLLNI